MKWKEKRNVNRCRRATTSTKNSCKNSFRRMQANQKNLMKSPTTEHTFCQLIYLHLTFLALPFFRFYNWIIPFFLFPSLLLLAKSKLPLFLSVFFTWLWVGSFSKISEVLKVIKSFLKLSINIKMIIGNY